MIAGSYSGFVHYQVTRKNPHHGEAIAAGFGARCVPAESAVPIPGSLHLIGGLQHGSVEILRQIRELGEPYVFFDRAYFRGGRGSDKLRAVPNALQQHWLVGRGPERWEKLGLRFEPWRKSGRHILWVPPGVAIQELLGIEAQIAAMPRKLVEITDRPVDTSIKGDPRPLAQRLKDCWCVVTWCSNVAVEAVLAGIPAFVDAHAAAAPVCCTLDQLETRLEKPAMPDRERWAWSLAWGQFSLNEIASGLARETIMESLQ